MRLKIIGKNASCKWFFDIGCVMLVYFVHSLLIMRKAIAIKNYLSDESTAYRIEKFTIFVPISRSKIKTFKSCAFHFTNFWQNQC